MSQREKNHIIHESLKKDADQFFKKVRAWIKDDPKVHSRVNSRLFLDELSISELLKIIGGSLEQKRKS
jgi:hypothetical protein